MRLRLRTRPAVLFGAFFVLALLALLPLRLVLGWVGLDQAGIAARRVTGSIWWGALTEAQVGALPLGDVEARLSPVPLLVGRARVHFEGREAPGVRSLQGAIGVTRHSLGIDDVTAALAAGNVFAPLPVAALNLTDVSIRFGDTTCDHAEGRVQATLAGDVGGVPLNQTLSGAARCDAGALLLPLASAGGAQTVTLRFRPDGRYQAALTLTPGDQAQAAQLTAAGFQQTPQGWRLAVDGRL